VLERLEIYGERLEVESDIYLNFLPLTYPTTEANIGSSAVGLAKHHDHRTIRRISRSTRGQAVGFSVCSVMG
jgi:hypothetical protein